MPVTLVRPGGSPVEVVVEDGPKYIKLIMKSGTVHIIQSGDNSVKNADAFIVQMQMTKQHQQKIAFEQALEVMQRKMGTSLISVPGQPHPEIRVPDIHSMFAPMVVLDEAWQKKTRVIDLLSVESVEDINEFNR